MPRRGQLIALTAPALAVAAFALMCGLPFNQDNTHFNLGMLLFAIVSMLGSIVSYLHRLTYGENNDRSNHISNHFAQHLAKHHTGPHYTATAYASYHYWELVIDGIGVAQAAHDENHHDAILHYIAAHGHNTDNAHILIHYPTETTP